MQQPLTFFNILRRFGSYFNIYLLFKPNILYLQPAFTPSLEVFDLVIYLKNVNSSSRPNPDDKKAEVATDVLPIVGFDPVEIYLNQLEVNLLSSCVYRLFSVSKGKKKFSRLSA